MAGLSTALEMTMEPRELQPGEIVQLTPDHEWGPCLLVVSEPKGFGCQGYVQTPMKGAAFLRPTFEQIEPVNAMAIWVCE